MSSLVAAVASIGLLLVFDGLTRKRAESRRMSVPGRIEELAVESGIRGLTATRLILWCTASGVLAAFVAAGLTGSLVVAAAVGIPCGVWPLATVRGRRDRRRRRLREAWPDALSTLVAGVRAGLSLPECCASLAERGPQELRPGAGAFVAAYRSSGSFSAALSRMQQELSDPIADRVVTALRLAHEVGGTDLVRLLRASSDFLREDLRVRKEIEARWSWTVTAARLAAAAPWVVLLLMATRPEAARAYESPTGAAIVAGGAACTVLGYRLMLRAARLPEEKRFLR